MNKIKRLLWNKGSSIAYAIITAIFTLVPEGVFKFGIVDCTWPEGICILINRLIVCILVFSLANIAYRCHRKHRKEVAISGKTFSIKIEFNDLFKVKCGKKVINFDECFTTKVGEKPEDIKPDSLCGQYLMKYPINNMQELIDATGLRPIGASLYKNRPKYAQGTLIPRDDFLLMAFAELDEKGRGTITYDKYLECLNRLWEQIDLYHGTDDVYLPILGSRITRFDKELTQQELLDIMITSYRLSPKKLKRPSVLHIVCKEREGFSLNNVYGLD